MRAASRRSRSSAPGSRSSPCAPWTTAAWTLPTGCGRVDRRYAGATDLDERFTGFAKDHFVDLDFGDRLKDLPPGSRLVLFLHGWVEYGYSSTNFAAARLGCG